MNKRAWLTSTFGCLVLLGGVSAHAGSVQFFGNGANDIDRIKILIDDPANTDPGPPADIGATDFTIEFWIKGTLADNLGVATCGNVYGWNTGNVLLDRDRFGQRRSFGLSLSAGAVAFGAVNDANDQETLCGSIGVLNGAWHHVAVTRNATNGLIRIFVDGLFDQEANGPVGDLSYPDNGLPLDLCNTSPCANDPFLVLGAEKRDANKLVSPSFAGQVDELRLSTVIRYTANFTPATQPFAVDANTAALYHLDETDDDIDVADVLGLSPGVSHPGGTPKGPLWVADTPFVQAGPGTLQFSSQFYRAVEGVGTLHARVARAGGTSGAASVLCSSASGTAVSPDDFAPVSTTLNWADGDRSAKNCDVTIVADALPETTESLTLQLSNPFGSSLGDPATADVAIEEDVSKGVFRFTQGTAVVNERIGSFNLTVSRTGSTAGAVTVTLTGENGTADGTDFALSTPTLTWADGEGGNKNAVVSIVDDGSMESNETFTVRLSAASSGASIAAPSSVTVTITDDDSGGGGGGGGGSIEWWTLAFGVMALALRIGGVARPLTLVART